MKKAIIICGPTASGKSDFAHSLAKKYKGEIVNIDSRQIYKRIPIITASPAMDLQKELPYHLYNFLGVDQEFSVVKYIKLAATKIKEISTKGNIPIIVGGTGLYINALLFGYNEIPSISSDIREYVRKLYTKIGAVDFFDSLKILDPLSASKLNPNDTQRILRAFEVFKQTGKSIVSFQENQNVIPMPEFNFKIIFLYPERNFLYRICNERLEKMFNNGAIEEVFEIKKDLTNESGNRRKFPGIKKALGIEEIISYLDNEISLAKAIELTQNKTRQYAKRQITWFKNQITDKIVLEYSTIQEFEKLISSYNI